jgi:hypothetical protein
LDAVAGTAEMKQITVRPQRGGFADSMRESKIIPATHEAIADWIKTFHPLCETDQISVTHMGLDPRNGWNTLIICVNGNGVGFADLPQLFPTSPGLFDFIRVFPAQIK